MIKKFLLFLIISFLISNIYAQNYSFTLWGGMNSVSMGDINEMVEEYGDEDDDDKEITSGTQGVLEFSFRENTSYQPTIRISAISADKGSFVGSGIFTDEDGDGDIDEDGDIDTIVIGAEFKPALTAVEVGVKFPWIEYGRYKNSIGAFIGYGMASVATKAGMVVDTTDESLIVYQEDTYTGSAITFSIMDYNEIELSSRFSLGLIFGYNIAKVSEVKDSDGDSLTTLDGDKVAIDYSGLCYGLSLKYKF